MATPKVSTKQTIIATPDQDALQIKDITGDILGWIDATGTGQGTLAAGGGSITPPAGANGTIQYNNNGAFGGISQMTFDGAATLSMVTLVVQTHRNSTSGGYDAYVHDTTNVSLGRAPGFNCFKSKGTQSAPGAVTSGDSLGYITWQGYDGTSYSNTATGAYFQATATENWNGTSHGAGYTFSACSNGQTVGVPALTITTVSGTSNGVGIGTLGNITPKFALHTSADAVALGAPASAPTDGNLNNSNISFYLDEVGNNLKVRVKYSNGTLKTATIALV